MLMVLQWPTLGTIMSWSCRWLLPTSERFLLEQIPSGSNALVARSRICPKRTCRDRRCWRINLVTIAGTFIASAWDPQLVDHIPRGTWLSNFARNHFKVSAPHPSTSLLRLALGYLALSKVHFYVPRLVRSPPRLKCGYASESGMMATTLDLA